MRLRQPTFTAEDAQIIAEYLAHTRTLTPEQIARYDVNRDGKVTVVDALAIGQMIVGVPGVLRQSTFETALTIPVLVATGEGPPEPPKANWGLLAILALLAMAGGKRNN